MSVLSDNLKSTVTMLLAGRLAAEGVKMSALETANLVLVDTAGFGSRAAAVAMTSADAVLVPCLSGEADLHEAEARVRLVRIPVILNGQTVRS